MLKKLKKYKLIFYCFEKSTVKKLFFTHKCFKSFVVWFFSYKFAEEIIGLASKLTELLSEN